MMVRVRAGTTVAELAVGARPTPGQMVAARRRLARARPPSAACWPSGTSGPATAPLRAGARHAARGPLRLRRGPAGQGRVARREERQRLSTCAGCSSVRSARSAFSPRWCSAASRFPASLAWYRVRRRRPLRPGRPAATGRRRSSGTAQRTWVLLEGHPVDVADQARSVLGAGARRRTARRSAPEPAASLPPSRSAGWAGAGRRGVAGRGRRRHRARRRAGAAGLGPEHRRPPGRRRRSPSSTGGQGPLRPGGRLNPGRSVL